LYYGYDTKPDKNYYVSVDPIGLPEGLWYAGKDFIELLDNNSKGQDIGESIIY